MIHQPTHLEARPATTWAFDSPSSQKHFRNRRPEF